MKSRLSLAAYLAWKAQMEIKYGRMYIKREGKLPLVYVISLNRVTFPLQNV